MDVHAPRQTYGFKFQDWTNPQLLITDCDGRVVFTGHMQVSDPHITLRTPDLEDIATASLPDINSGAIVTVRGRTFSIEKHGRFVIEHHFATADGAILIWRGQGRHMRCFDANDNIVVKVDRTGWSGRRRKLEITGEAIEELLFTAVVMISRERAQNKSGVIPEKSN